MTVTTIDPSTGRPLDAYEETTSERLESLLDAARSTYRDRRGSAPEQRAEELGRLAGELRRRKEELALLATLEMGKPLLESRAEVEKCAFACDWYAEHTPKLLAPEVFETEALRSEVLAQPLGIVFAIMPWNFPYWQVSAGSRPGAGCGQRGLAQACSLDDGLRTGPGRCRGIGGVAQRGSVPAGGEVRAHGGGLGNGDRGRSGSRRYPHGIDKGRKVRRGRGRWCAQENGHGARWQRSACGASRRRSRRRSSLGGAQSISEHRAVLYCRQTDRGRRVGRRRLCRRSFLTTWAS